MHRRIPTCRPEFSMDGLGAKTVRERASHGDQHSTAGKLQDFKVIHRSASLGKLGAMSFNLLPGKTIVITGAATGIGRATAIGECRTLPAMIVDLAQLLPRMAQMSCCTTWERPP